jgi:PAS domain S-box-containing protein
MSGSQPTAPETLLRSVLDNLLEGCQVVGPDYRYLFINDAAASHGRATRGQLLGRTMMDAYPGIEDTPMFSVLRKCMEERSPQQMENDCTLADGSKAWFELRFEPVPEGVTILSMDITARKRAEARVGHLNAVLRGIHNVNHLITCERDPQLLIRRACELLVEARGFDTCCIVICDGDQVKHAADAGASVKLRSLRKILQSGYLPDCMHRAIVEHDIVVRENAVESCRGCPVNEDYAAARDTVAIRLDSEGTVYGVLLASLPRGAASDSQEIDLIREVADDIAFALRRIETQAEHSRAEEALRLSAARWSATFDAISDIVCVISKSHEFVEINRPGCVAMGMPREMIIGRKCFELVHRSSVPIAECPCTQAALALKPATIVHEQDGRTFELAAWPIVGPNRQMEAFVHVVKDITERKRTDDEIKRKRDALQVIASTLEMSLLDVPLDRVLDKALDGILSIPWLSLESKGAVFLVEKSRSRLGMKAARNLTDAVRRSCATVPFGQCLCGRAAASKSLVFSAHVDDCHDTRYSEIKDHGHYCVPIVFEGETIGVICTYLAAGHERRAEEEELLLAVANALAGMVARRQAEHELVQANQTLRMTSECNQVLVRAATERELVDEICRIICDLGGYRMAWVGYAESDPAKTIRLAGAAGCEGRYLERARITWADEERGRGPTGTSIRLRTVCFGRNYLTDPELAPWREEAARHGFQSSIALPLVSGNHALGALTIYADKPDAFSAAQTSLLSEFADDLAFGITALRAHVDRDRARRDAEHRAGQLRALAAELVKAEQRERQRLAKVLHDHIQQLLVGAKLGVAVLARKSWEESQQVIGHIVEALDEAIQASRTLTSELSPPALREQGLGAGLQWLQREVKQRHGLNVDIQIENTLEIADDFLRVFLFEAVRELLFNVVKHAGVDQARVEVARIDEGKIQVTVTDSGVGFAPERIDYQSGTGGFGLFSIRERLSYLGGHMEVESAPGQGSRFVLVAPGGDSVAA